MPAVIAHADDPGHLAVDGQRPHGSLPGSQGSALGDRLAGRLNLALGIFFNGAGFRVKQL